MMVGQRRLGINILSGFMRAYEQNSNPEVSWSGDDRVHTVEEIAAGIGEAIKATGSRGSYISILIEHELVKQRAYEIPTMSGGDLETYLTRKINDDKDFDDPVTYSYITNNTGDGKMHVTVSYLPAPFVESMKQACMDNGAYLMQLLPVSFVVADQFRQYPVGDGESAALLLRLGKKSNIVIGKPSGYMLSERSISFDPDNDDVSRLAKEINRSILHNKQQFGEKVTVLHIAESYPKEVLEGLRKDLSIEVKYIERSGRFFWIKEMFNIPYGHENNLIHTGTRVDMFMKRFTTLAASAVLILWLGAIASFIGVEYMIHEQQKQSWTETVPLPKLERELAGLQTRNRRYDNTKLAVDSLRQGQRPVAAWLVGFLADSMPKELILTDTTVEKVDGRWHVGIAGFSRRGENHMAKDIEELANNLSEGPLLLHVDNSWYDKWIASMRTPTAQQTKVLFSMKGEVK